MNAEDFMAIVMKHFPDAVIDEATDGEIIIATNMVEDEAGNLILRNGTGGKEKT
jgi:hypothetical protein